MLRRLNAAAPAIAPYAIAGLALAARLLPSARTIDDAYITFRYARNLLEGSGFVYNPGERVLGTTTPLYTLLMAGLAGATGSQDYPWIALIVNSLADAAACLLLIRLGQRLSGRREVGLAAGLLWAIAPMSVTFAIGGMETSVFIFLLVLTGLLYLEGRTRWAALAAGLLLVTRPDGALFAGLLALDVLARGLARRQIPWDSAGILLLSLAPWALFATFYFGSPFPHSIAAKSLAYRLSPESALVRLIQHYGTPFFEHLLLGQFWPLIGFVVYGALSAIGGLSAVRRNSRAWPLAVYPWLYFVVFSAANPLIFRWYLAPPLPFYFVLILTGLAKIIGDLLAAREARRVPGEHGSVPARAARPSTALRFAQDAAGLPSAFRLLPIAFFLIASLNGWTLRPDHGPQRPAPAMAWHQLELLYEDVGRELASQVQPGDVVAAGDVGALGFYSRARILDTVGLMSPEASAYYPLDPALYVINYAVPAQLILDAQPDYVVLLEVYGRRGLFSHPDFLAEYALLVKIDSDIYGSDGLLVFKRQSTAARPASGAAALP